MLQPPSHLSRVCGHGHIKKFWLMQTQKESQACENKSNMLFSSPPSRSANRASVKGIETPPWSSSPLPHSAFGDLAGTSSKHTAFTRTESLSPSPHSCKANPTPSPSLGLSAAEPEKERLNGCYDYLDSFSMTASGDAQSTTPLPSPHPFNAAPEQILHGSTALHADIDFLEPSPARTNGSSKEQSSSLTDYSPDSHSSQFSRGIQGIIAHRPLETGSKHAVKVEDRSSVANSNRDLKSFSSHVRFTTSMNVDTTVEKGRGGGLLSSRMPEIDHDGLSQASYIQNPVLKACSLCGTTKTPMWRSGPQGPKSLCNACGIRFKKYRSFPGQESAELMSSPLLGTGVSKPPSRPLKRKQNSSFSSCDPPRSQKMSSKPEVPDVTVRQQQKKSRWQQLVVEREHIELKDLSQDRPSPWFTRAGPPSLKKIYGCSPFQSKFKKVVPMEDHLSVNGVFAKDEEEAAVLLMHLSCGLVY